MYIEKPYKVECSRVNLSVKVFGTKLERYIAFTWRSTCFEPHKKSKKNNFIIEITTEDWRFKIGVKVKDNYRVNNHAKILNMILKCFTGGIVI